MAINSPASTLDSFTPETPSPSERAANLLSRLDVNRLQTSPEGIVLLLALVVGGGAGLVVVLFRILIGLVHGLVLEDLMGAIANGRPWALACAPVVGGIIVGLLRWRMKEFGSGLASLNAAVQNAQDVPVLRPIVRGLAAAVSLGSGASLGPEGPSVELGASVGALLGQALRVSKERQRLLLGAGAAAGLAAGFNAPIAGVFFALEVVLGTTFAASAASVVLLAAVVSSLVAQIGLGARPAFSLPIYEVRSPLELPLYLGLGLLASGVSICYTYLNQWMPKFFRGEIEPFGGLGEIPVAVRPVLGGLIVGLAGLLVPQVLGIGYETVEAVLRDVDFPLLLLAGLVAAKLVLTAVSLGSGLVGGVFAPAMFLGAALGGAYGKALPLVLPWFASSIAAPPAYATVGMAAVLASSVRAPLTAVLLLFELTRDYRIVLPLMAAVGLSVWLTDFVKQRLERSPEPVTQPAVKVTPKETVAEEEVDPLKAILQRFRVGDVMRTAGMTTFPDSLSLTDAGLLLTDAGRHSALILDGDKKLVGILTLQDVNRALARWNSQDGRGRSPRMQTSGEVCSRNLLFAFRDEPVVEAMDRMAARGLHQLPVVDREDSQMLLGLLCEDGIDLACNVAMTKEALENYFTAETVG